MKGVEEDGSSDEEVIRSSLESTTNPPGGSGKKLKKRKGKQKARVLSNDVKDTQVGAPCSRGLFDEQETEGEVQDVYRDHTPSRITPKSKPNDLDHMGLDSMILKTKPSEMRRRQSLDSHGTERVRPGHTKKTNRTLSVDGYIPLKPMPPSRLQSQPTPSTSSKPTAEIGCLIRTGNTAPSVAARSVSSSEGSTSLMHIVGCHTDPEPGDIEPIVRSPGSKGADDIGRTVARVPPPVSRDELDAVVTPLCSRTLGGLPASQSMPALISNGGEARVNRHTQGLPASQSMPALISNGGEARVIRRTQSSQPQSAMKDTSHIPSPLPPRSQLKNGSGMELDGSGKEEAEKGKEKPPDRADTEDEASESSHEIGHDHEMLEDNQETVDKSARDDQRSLPVPPSPEKHTFSQSDPQTAQNVHQGHIGSNRGTSTPSTEPSPSPTSPLPPHKKSVRVSLQPAFSPAPPVCEDDTASVPLPKPGGEC
jgi:hypothetical protein